MKVIRPVTVTGAILASSSVAQDDHPEWAAGTTYPLGARVIVAATHRVYESAIENNLGNDPADALGGAWVDVGPTNRWAMFDSAGGPRTIDAGQITVELVPSMPVSALGLLDLASSEVRVQVFTNGVSLYDSTELAPGSSLSSLDLPAVGGQRILVTASAAGNGYASIGKLVIGDAVDLGQTEDGPTASIIDYSRRETDAFGVTSIVERAWARRIGARSRLSSDDVDAVQRYLASIRATPVMWIGEPGFEALSVFGYFKEFSIDLQLGSTSFCSLTIEGLPSAEVPVELLEPAIEGASDLLVISPTELTSGMLTSSNIAEDEAPLWQEAGTYQAGDRVIWDQTHRIYESLVPANIGRAPSDVAAWLDLGATNRWAMFDEALGTLTTGTSVIDVTIAPTSRVQALSVLDTDASSVRVRAEGYDRTVAIAPDAGLATFLDLDVAAGATIQVTINAEGVNLPVSAGTLLFGPLLLLGVTEDTPTIGITDYSVKSTDDFGSTTAVERAWAKRVDVRSLVRSGAVEQLTRSMAALRARPALWIGHDDFEALSIYGFFKDFTATLSERTSKCSFTIEGLSKAANIALPDEAIVLVTVYRNAAVRPPAPTFDTGQVPTGWSAAPQELATGEYRWSTQAQFRGAAQRTEWSAPVVIAGVSWADVIDDDPENPKPEPGATVGASEEERDRLDKLEAAPLVQLTNATIVIPSYSNGAVIDYSGAAGQLVATRADGTDVSDAFALAVKEKPADLLVYIEEQTYAITAGVSDGVDTATLTLRATGSGAYAGQVYDLPITLTKSAGGYEIVGALPTDNLFAGRIVFLTSDSKLYRYDGNGWTAKFDADDLLGEVSRDNIDPSLLSDISDLQEVYGDTESAAASAAAAQAAQSGAETARSLAQDAQSDAEAAQSASEQAKQDALDAAAAAGGSASAANTSAGTATTKAGEAGQSATAAAASATSAQTSAGSAQTHATNAAISSTNAGTSANAAASSAGVAAQSAKTAIYLDAGYVADFSNNATEGWGGSNATVTPGPTGLTLEANLGSNDPILAKSGLALDGSKYLRVVVEITRTANRTSGGWDGYLFWATAGHSWSGTYQLRHTSAVSDPKLNERVQLVFDLAQASATALADWAGNTITGLRLDFDQGQGSAFIVHSVRVVGADSLAPVKAASAAASSASTAATRADEASQSASAASTSETNAATSAGNASTSASQASTSASDALGSKNAAANSAGAAATSATNAGNSASAASTSAQTATTKASEASQSASAAATSATNANTAAGNASTYAGQASNSADDADGSASAAAQSAGAAATSAGNAGNSASAAASSASSASTSASNAGASASSASNSASVAASTAAGLMNPNPMFADWLDGATYPTRWADWSGGAATISRIAGEVSPYAVRLGSVANDNRGISQTGANAPAALSAGDWVVIEADIKLNSGSLIGAGVLLRGTNTGECRLVFATDPDTKGNTIGAGSSGSVYRFRKLIQMPSGTNTAALFLMNHWSNFGSTASANDITWYRCGWRVASAAEIKTGQIDALSASVTQQASALASVEGKTVAYWSVLANAGTSNAIIAARADGAGTSNVTMAAQKVVLANLAGTTLYDALVIENGNATLAGKLRAGAVVTDNLAAGAVTAAKINVTDLSAITGNIGTLTTGTIRNAADTYRIDATNGRSIMRAGGYMKVSGAPFGSSSQFLEWYGPEQANLANCTEANAITYMKTNGSAYFGGTLSAGVRKNAAQTTVVGGVASVEIGPFGSGGGARNVVLSFSYNANYSISNTASYSGSMTGTIYLDKWNGSAWVNLTSATVSGYVAQADSGGGVSEPGTILTLGSGSLTFTDNSGGTSGIQYRARLANFTDFTINSNVISQQKNQTLGIVSTE